MYKSFTWDYLPEFTKALQAQLEDDQKRWGDTWKQRSIVNQEERIFAELVNYYDQWKHAGQPIPWLKIAGLALIGWVREQENK